MESIVNRIADTVIPDAMPAILEVIPIKEADLENLLTSTEGEPTVRRLRARHHEIARLIATGMRPVDVAAIMSVTHQSISTITSNPAFQELLSQYMSARDEEVVMLGAKVHMLAHDAVDQLQRTLQEGDHTPEFVRRVTMDLLDRSGVGPTSKVVSNSESVNVFEIKDRAATSPYVKPRPFVDITPEDQKSEESANSGAAEKSPAVGKEVPPQRAIGSR